MEDAHGRAGAGVARADPGTQLGGAGRRLEGARCTHTANRDAWLQCVGGTWTGELTVVDHHQPKVAARALDESNHLVVGPASHPVAIDSDQPVLLPQARKL